MQFELITAKASGRFKSITNGFKFVLYSRTATIGMAIVGLWFLVGLVSFIWTPYDPNEMVSMQNLPPSFNHLLGTDHMGRDIMSRLMQGTQVILLKTRMQGGNWALPGGVAILGVAGSLMLGTFLGLNAGYRGGRWDLLIMQILDALIAFPRIVLYLVVIAALGQGDLVVVFAITLTGAPGIARLARSLALDIMTRDYMRAAETRAESIWYILFKEILPNIRGPLLVDSMLRLGYAIFMISTLGFLGIGLPPPDPDWGGMVSEARKHIFINQMAVIWPAGAIASLVIGLNLFADGLREEMSRFMN